VKILTWIETIRKTAGPEINCKHRILTIGYYLISCDIYPRKHGIIRAERSKTFEKKALIQSYSPGMLFEFPIALFYPCEYLEKGRHFPIEILSVLKPHPAPYPADFTIYLYCT